MRLHSIPSIEARMSRIPLLQWGRTSTFVLVAIIALGLGLTGCGQDDPARPKLPASFEVTPKSHSFGAIPLGSTQSVSITVRNTGGQSGSIDPRMGSGSAGSFVIVSGTGARELAPGASHTVVVRFAPSSAGSQSGTLEVASTRVSLLGTGDPPPSPDLMPINVPGGLVAGGMLCGGRVNLGESHVRCGNRGNLAASAPVVVQLRVMNTATNRDYVIRSWSDFTNGNVWLPGVDWYIPAQPTDPISCMIPAGSYRFVVVVDPNNRVKESNESNNRLESSGTFLLFAPTAVQDQAEEARTSPPWLGESAPVGHSAEAASMQ
jgi:hypothetical protein